MAWLWQRRLPPARTYKLSAAVHSLRQLVKSTETKGISMTAATPPDPTNPTDQVSVSQSWLTWVGSTVSTATSVLGPYIQQLIAGESVQLSPAEVDDVTAALAGLTGIEPPAPASP